MTVLGRMLVGATALVGSVAGLTLWRAEEAVPPPADLRPARFAAPGPEAVASAAPLDRAEESAAGDVLAVLAIDPHPEPDRSSVLVAGKLVDPGWNPPCDSVRVAGGSLEQESCPASDGSFLMALETAELAPGDELLFTAARGGSEVSARIDIGRRVRQALDVELDRGAAPAVVDVGRIQVGATLSARLAIEDRAGNPVRPPFEVWLAPVPQGPLGRGSRARPSAGVNTGGALVPVLLAAVAPGEPAAVQLPESGVGGNLHVVSPSGVSTQVLGAEGVLADGQTLHLVEAPWHCFRVRVLCDGEPVEGASVSVTNDGLCRVLEAFADRTDVPARVAGTTDGRGYASLRLVPTDELTWLVAESDEGTRRQRLTDLASAEYTLELGPWESSGQELVFVDAEGQPVDGVVAELNRSSLPRSGPGGCSIPRGRRCSTPAWLTATADGYVRKQIRLGAREEAERTVSMERSRSLHVEVIDDAAQGVAGVLLHLDPGPGNAPRVQSVATDALGRASFPEVPEGGPVAVQVVPPSPRVAWSDRFLANGRELASNQRVELVPGDETLSLVLRRSPVPRYTLRVRALHDETGQPQVIQRLAFTHLDDDGTRAPDEVVYGNEFALVESLAAGEYLVWVSALNGLSGVWPLSLRDDLRTLDLPVGSSRDVRGHVSVASGSPPNEVFVAATPAGMSPLSPSSPSEREWPALFRDTCDELGEFVLRDLPPGLFELHAVRPFRAEYEPVTFDSLASAGGVVRLSLR